MKVIRSGCMLVAVIASIISFLQPATADFGFDEPSPRRSHPVQPADRFAGNWVAETDALKDYYNSVLQPVNAVCESIEGPLYYSFFPPSAGSSATLTINTEKITFTLKRTRRGRPEPDTIIFTMSGGHQAPITFDTGEQLLLIDPKADFGLFKIETVSVNGILFEGGEADTLGISFQFSAAVMRFEFLGNDRLSLTPIFPPGPDGSRIFPRPIILRRR